MKKTTTLIKNADVIVTMDAKGTELKGTNILIENGSILGVGNNLTSADEVIDANGCVVTPGLINTHHHFISIFGPRSACWARCFAVWLVKNALPNFSTDGG